MTENLKILDVPEHIGKDGTFYTVVTEKKEYNCYDLDLCEFLYDNRGKVMELDIRTPKTSGKEYIVSAKPVSNSNGVVSSFAHPVRSTTPSASKDNAIRAAVAFKGCIDLCVAGIITKEEIRDRMLIFYAELKELEK